VVYVTRTNVDIDDELVAKVMQRYGLASKRAAVDLALRRLAGEPAWRHEALGLEGSGWDADLEDLRSQTGA
jgi:Arc/MetJ family transcription regulator